MLITGEPFFDYVPEPVSVAFQARTSNATNLTTYTFAAANIGAANPRRSLIVGITHSDGSPRTIDTVTVGGQSMSLIFDQQYAGSGTFRCSFWGIQFADTFTDTTADIVVTHSASVGHCVINVWAVYNLQSISAFDTAADTGINVTSSLNLDVPTSGAAFGLSNGNLSATATWTGLTEDADAVIETIGGSAASGVFASSETNRTITVDLTGTQTSQNAAAISLR
jgi:hypothetical protein